MEYRLPRYSINPVADAEEEALRVMQQASVPTAPQQPMLPRTRKKSAGGSVTNNVKPEDELGSGRGMLSRALQMVSQQPDVTALNEFAQQRMREGDSSMLNALAAQFAGSDFEPVQGVLLKRAMAAQEPQKVGNYGLISGGRFVADPYAARDTQANAMMDIGGELFRDEQATAREERLNRQFETRLARMGAGGGGGGGRNIQQSNTFLLPDGSVVKGLFDKNSGQLMYQSESGLTPLPAGSRPTTSETGGFLSPQQYTNMRRERFNDSKALNAMNRYFESQGGTNIGLRRMADSVSANFKTLIGQRVLDPAELSLQVAQGNLQGLLGLFREDIVGPGVMTEQDAQRVLAALGGDVNALQSPQRVEAALRTYYQSKLSNIEFLDEELSRNNPVFGNQPMAAPPPFKGGSSAPSPQGGGFGEPPPGAVKRK